MVRIRSSCTRNPVSARLKLQMRQTITEGTRVLWKESAHRFRTFQYFAESCHACGKVTYETRHSFRTIPFFSLVRFSEYVYANSSSTCVRCTHLSSQKLAWPLELNTGHSSTKLAQTVPAVIAAWMPHVTCNSSQRSVAKFPIGYIVFAGPLWKSLRWAEHMRA